MANRQGSGRRRARGNRLSALTPAELRRQFLALRDDAATWRDHEITPKQERAWRYYDGQVQLDDPGEGYSKFVCTEVSDAVENIQVSLMRIFATAKSIVHFSPGGPDDHALAKQQTDGANHVFFNDNPGYSMLEGWLREGNVAKLCVAKVFWCEAEDVQRSRYTGLSEDAYVGLAADDDIEIEDFKRRKEGIACTLTRNYDASKIKIESVAAEEFLIDKRAGCIDDSIIHGWDGYRRAQDIVAEGDATYKDLEKWADGSSGGNPANITQARNARAGYNTTVSSDNAHQTLPAIDEANRLVRISDLYVRLDADGDGIPELYNVKMIESHVVSYEIVDVSPYFIGSPIPRPHTAIGRSMADLTMDLQDVKTATTRGMLDSLYASIEPLTTAVQGQVNMKDLFTPKRRKTVRVRQQGAVERHPAHFVGADVLEVNNHFDQVREMRTGVTRASLGLDPDALQSTTEFAVQSHYTAAAAKPEMVARTYAESFFCPIFKRIAELMAMHVTREVTVYARGQYIEVDPRQWLAPFNVLPNVGLGRGGETEKMQHIDGVISEQKEIAQLYGPNQPYYRPEHVANALNDGMEAMGMPDGARYFNSPQEVQATLQQQAEQAAQQPPPVDPDVLKVEKQAALDEQKAQQDFELRSRQLEAEIALNQWKAEQEIILKRAELAAEIELEEEKIERTPQASGVGEVAQPN